MWSINIANVINLLIATFNIANFAVSPVNHHEVELHDAISDLIKNAINDNVEIENNWVLDFDDPTEPHDVQFVDVYDIDADEDNYEDEVCIVDNEGGNVNLNYKRKAVEFWNSGKKGRLSITAVQNRFRKVKSISQLHRWEENVMRGGSNRDKLIFIAEYVLMQFQEALARQSIIHDIDLRKWALQAKEQINLPSFRAGNWWIWNFKKAHHITSRKITTFKTRSSHTTDETIRQSAEEFVRRVKPHIDEIGAGSIYNADESGFNLEIHSGRTLTNVGVKKVESTIQSLSSMSHSYTIMPIISADGHLLSPLYIVLKESSGQFGPRVKETLFRPVNVHIAVSKSGKLTSQHFKNWFEEIYLRNTGEKSILLLDSWTGHCPEQLKEFIPADKQVNILTIPKKTTAFVQPLDVFGFRIWKHFVRCFSDNIILHNYDINLHARNNIIKLQSLTHNQLSSPRFQNLFKYSWYKSGYLSTRPEKFDNPINFCYFKEEKHIPRCNICGKMAFIRCAWCQEYYCFEHFFEQYHYCNNYIQ